MAKLAIIGSGFVGKATGKGFNKQGHEVVFCDVDRRVLKSLYKEGFRVSYPDSLEKDFDAFFISVFTPTAKGRINLTCLMEAAKNLGRILRNNNRYCVVVPRSTILPGTTKKVIIPHLQKQSGMLAGMDFGVCYNPEFLRERTSQNDFDNPRQLLLGELDEKSGDFLSQIYGFVSCPIRRVSIEQAELQKYTHNAYNATKISFCNEIRMICQKAGLNADEILQLVMETAEASWNPMYGARNLGAFGGSCLPKDIVALNTWAQEELGINTELLEAVISVNKEMISRNGGFSKLGKKEAVY